MNQTKHQQHEILSDHLATRRSEILLAWRRAVDADPAQTTAHALTRGQFNDHIPEVLDAFEQKLRSRPGGAEARAADLESKHEEVKHGLHRWQQGYRMQELMRDVTVAADEYVWEAAGGLTLGELVSLLGIRADALTELWNDWGAIRPLLLAAD